MASEQDAYAALERWHRDQAIRPYSEQQDDEPMDSGFLAGYEAGHDELRDKILGLISALMPQAESARSILMQILG